jgi:ferric-dicitrate binding protein FerR (iron transport regulator)
MTCEEAENLISARIDGELFADDPAAVALEAHLTGCATCRAMAEAMAVQDAALVRAFAPERRVANTVAERVAAPLSVRRASPQRRWIIGLAASAIAASVFISVATLWPRHHRDDSRATATPPATQPAADLIAQVALSTGEVFTCPADKTDEWKPLTSGAAIATGDRVRTSPSARVELVMADGSQVRLNGETEATLSGDRCVELKQGQLWSAVPEKAQPLCVVALPVAEANDRVTVVTPPGARVDFRCESKSSVLTAVEGSATVTDARGGEARVSSGNAMTLVNGLASASSGASDVLLTTRWLNDLLVLKGGNDPEVAARVKELLSRINQENPATRPIEGPVTPGPIEQMVRSQGERWSNPFACHVRSPESLNDPAARVTAARLLADLAPPSAITDLIALLADRDGQIRFYAATALHRLTGQTLGRSPAECSTDSPATAEQTRRAWQAWWDQHNAQGT